MSTIYIQNIFFILGIALAEERYRKQDAVEFWWLTFSESLNIEFILIHQKKRISRRNKMMYSSKLSFLRFIQVIHAQPMVSTFETVRLFLHWNSRTCIYSDEYEHVQPIYQHEKRRTVWNRLHELFRNLMFFSPDSSWSWNSRQC